MTYEVIDEVSVKFQPAGSLAEMDFSKAIESLNMAEESLQVKWVKVGSIEEDQEGYKPKGDLVDMVYGHLSMNVGEGELPAFRVVSMEGNMMNITIFDTPQGKALNAMLDNCAPIRFTALVDVAEDGVSINSFTRFYVVNGEPLAKQVTSEIVSNFLALPGKDFQVSEYAV